MKRRTFIHKTVAGVTAFGTVGCSVFGRKKYKLPRKLVKYSPEILKQTKQKPVGIMPMHELGSTGIKVSVYSFGSHITGSLIPYEKERERMIREAFDLGINLFDIYDNTTRQYEPMSRFLSPIKKDVLISVHGHEYGNVYEGNPKSLNGEDGIEKTLRVFKRDYIDFVRNISPGPDNKYEKDWEVFFRMKEKGYIRFVGTAIHRPNEADHIIDTYPIDYLIFPYNFYHNLNYTGEFVGDFNPLVKKLRDRGIGVITMKPFASEWFIPHLLKVSKTIDKAGNISLGPTMLMWSINSGLEPDTTLGCMYSIYEM